MPANLQFKKKYITYLAVFLLFLILYSNYYAQNNSWLGLEPFLHIKISALYTQEATNLINFAPYLIIISLIAYSLFGTARQVNNDVYRRSFKIFMYGLLIIILFLVLSSPGTNINNSDKSSSTSNSSNISSTVSVSSSVSISDSTSSLTGFRFTSVTPLGNFGIVNILLLLIVLSAIALIILVSRLVLKAPKKKLEQETEKKVNAKQYDPIKGTIIAEYLKLSQILESKGINPDYSLTPIEFHDETQKNIEINEFQVITFYYELARFSSDEISRHDYTIFQENLEKIYAEINKREKIKIQAIDKNKGTT